MIFVMQDPAPLTRRRFLAASALSIASLPQSRADTFTANLLEPIRTISHFSDRYQGWPTLARQANGQLLLAYSGGRQAHVCPFGRVEFMTSSDDGQSWSWPQVIHDSPIDDRDAGILETSQGTLLATTFTSLAYESILEQQENGSNWTAKKLSHWRAAHHRLTAAERQAQLGQWVIRSTDSGISWQAASRCPVNSPHGPIQLADGRLLYAGKELWTGQRRVGVCESRDDGQTWTWLSEIPTRPNDQASDYHELHAIETGDNRILVQIRNHNPTNARETLQCESSDGGSTWTQPQSIDVWGLPSHLLKLRDQRLVMTYGYRRRPYGNQARISENHGRTWSAPITLSSDGVSGDLGYPSSVELADGSLLTVWYEKQANHSVASLRQAHWTLQAG